MHEHRTAVLRNRSPAALHAVHLVLDRSDGREEVLVLEHAMKRHRAVLLPQLVRGVLGQHVSPTRAPERAVRLEQQRADEVEPKSVQVNEVVSRQRFAAQMGVHQANATQTTRRRAKPSDVRQKDLRRIANDDRLDLSRARDEHTDLAIRRR
jgi:hypothetical protein